MDWDGFQLKFEGDRRIEEQRTCTFVDGLGRDELLVVENNTGSICIDAVFGLLLLRRWILLDKMIYSDLAMVHLLSPVEIVLIPM